MKFLPNVYWIFSPRFSITNTNLIMRITTTENWERGRFHFSVDRENDWECSKNGEEHWKESALIKSFNCLLKIKDDILCVQRVGLVGTFICWFTFLFAMSRYAKLPDLLCSLVSERVINIFKGRLRIQKGNSHLLFQSPVTIIALQVHQQN